MSKTTIPTGGIGADAITAAKIADDAISEEHLDPTAITASTEKSTLVAADKFLIADSAASNAIKYVQQSNLGSGTTVQLARAEGTSSVSDITLDLFSDTYDFYRFRGWFNCTASGNEWRMRFRDGGSDITASYYVCIGSSTEVYSSGSQDLGATMENWNSDHIRFANNSNSNDNIPMRLDAVFYDFNARDAGNSAGLQYSVTNYRTDDKLRTLQGSAGYFNQGSGDSYEGFKLYTNGGSIEYYSYVLYGYKKS